MSVSAEKSITMLSPAEAKKLLDEGRIVLLDVRTEVEHAAVRPVGAKHVPLDRLDPQSLVREHDGKLIACICKSGARGTKAAQAILDAGATGVANVVGGLAAWEAAGLPVERQSNVLPLERQTQIVAGALVLSGVVLGFLVHPGFFGLSAFVGAGLMFAGATGFCGLGLVLARMPWNRNLKSKNCPGGDSCAAS